MQIPCDQDFYGYFSEIDDASVADSYQSLSEVITKPSLHSGMSVEELQMLTKVRLEGGVFEVNLEISPDESLRRVYLESIQSYQCVPQMYTNYPSSGPVYVKYMKTESFNPKADPYLPIQHSPRYAQPLPACACNHPGCNGGNRQFSSSNQWQLPPPYDNPRCLPSSFQYDGNSPNMVTQEGIFPNHGYDRVPINSNNSSSFKTPRSLGGYDHNSRLVSYDRAPQPESLLDLISSQSTTTGGAFYDEYASELNMNGSNPYHSPDTESYSNQFEPLIHRQPQHHHYQQHHLSSSSSVATTTTSFPLSPLTLQSQGLSSTRFSNSFGSNNGSTSSASSGSILGSSNRHLMYGHHSMDRPVLLDRPLLLSTATSIC